MYLLLLLAQNIPTELQVCPHPQPTGLVSFGAKLQVNWQSAKAKVLLCPLMRDTIQHRLSMVAMELEHAVAMMP